eukprot:m51a1_g13445 hypothetical protein (335) ;mRNA; r:122-1515
MLSKPTASCEVCNAASGSNEEREHMVEAPNRARSPCGGQQRSLVHATARALGNSFKNLVFSSAMRPAALSHAGNDHLLRNLSVDPICCRGLFTDYGFSDSACVVARIYDPDGARMLAREVAALSALGGAHAWAPAVVGHHRASGLVLLQLPADAPTLADLRAREHSFRELFHAWLRLGDAVRCLRHLGWVHAALSPECVRVTEGSRVVVSEWGHASRVERSCWSLPCSYCSLWSGRCQCGLFAPPEQAAGGPGRHADVYAWVGLLYWLVTGSPPAARRRPCNAASTGVAGCNTLERCLFAPALDVDPQQRLHDIGLITVIAQSWFANHRHDLGC